MDLITVIIPAFNAENTIKRCLDSIIKQSYKNLEIIIIDDGSTDRTNEISNSFAKKDNRIHLITQSNQGVSSARNKGLRAASGEYILFVDADDYVSLDMIEKIYQVYEADPEIDLVVCGYDEIINGKIHVPYLKCSEEISQIQFLRNIFSPYSIKGFLVNKLFRMDIIKKNKIWLNESIYICEDLLFCCEYGMYVYKAIYLPISFYHYIMDEESATHSKYSWKRFTAVYAFQKINEVIEPLNDKQLREMVDAHYIIICIQLFKRLLEKDKNVSGKEMGIVLSILRKMDMKFLTSSWPYKYKFTYLFLKCFLLIKGVVSSDL